MKWLLGITIIVSCIGSVGAGYLVTRPHAVQAWISTPTTQGASGITPGSLTPEDRSFISTATSQILLCLSNVVNAQTELSQNIPVQDPTTLGGTCDPTIYPQAPQDQNPIIPTIMTLEQKSWSSAQALLHVNPNSITEVQDALARSQALDTQISPVLNTLTTYLTHN